MPGHPRLAASVAAIGGAVYSALAHRLATFEGETYPFHVGDTWLEPAAGSRMEDLTVAEHPGMHRYAPRGGCRRCSRRSRGAPRSAPAARPARRTCWSPPGRPAGWAP